MVHGGRRRPDAGLRRHLRRQAGLVLSRDRAFFATLLLLGITQGSSYLFIRVAGRELEPAVLMEIRLLFAAPILVAVCIASGRGAELRAAWREGLVVGVVGVAIPFTLIAWSERHVDSGVTAVANATLPIFVALIAAKVMPGERYTGLRLVGVLLGLGGVAFLAGIHPQGGWWGVAGTFAVVAAAPAYASATLYGQRQSAGGLVIAAGSLAWGAVALLPFALATLPAHAPGSKTFESLAALGIVCTCLPQVVYYSMVTWHGASRMALITYVTPVFALLLGAVFLGEPTTLQKLGALALIVVGVALAAGAGRGRQRVPQVVGADPVRP
jgi:drug/metabolite transporter (DMT)-like permease